MKLLVLLGLFAQTSFANSSVLPGMTILLPTTKKKAEIVAGRSISENRMMASKPQYLVEKCDEAKTFITKRLAMQGIVIEVKSSLGVNHTSSYLRKPNNHYPDYDFDKKLVKQEFFTEFGCRISLDLKSLKKQNIYLVSFGEGRGRKIRILANTFYKNEDRIVGVFVESAKRDNYVIGNKLKVYLLQAMK